LGIFCMLHLGESVNPLSQEVGQGKFKN